VKALKLFRDIRSLLICAVFLPLSSCLSECYSLIHCCRVAGRPLSLLGAQLFLRDTVSNRSGRLQNIVNRFSRFDFRTSN
jgi:hypothetical protein